MATRLMRGLRRRYFPTAQQQQVAAWQRADGDRTLALHFDLNESSLVFDLGGFEGQWTSDVYAMYRCTVHVFEPVARYAANIGERFTRNPQIVVHPCGLGCTTTEAAIAINGAASSTFSNAGPTERIQLVQAARFLEEAGIARIDLMKINIEGGEYDLLEHLIETEWVRRIDNLLIQFHPFVPQAETRMHAIQERLRATHDLAWQYVFVWEHWRRRG